MKKDVTAQDVLKSMRGDSRKLDEALDELEKLDADLRKARELINDAANRYRKEKTRKKSAKKAGEEAAYAELEDYPTREAIRDAYGYDMITETEMERLFYLWDMRETQAEQKKGQIYQDRVTEMLNAGYAAIEEKYRERWQELQEIRFDAEQAAGQRAQEINDYRHGLLGQEGL